MENFKVVPKWIVFPEIHLEANANYERNKPTLEEGYKLSRLLDYDESDNTLSIGITIKQEEQEDLNSKYTYSIQVYAIFEVEANLPKVDDKLLKKVIADIVNLLIGSLRDFIINLTARGPWGELILPILDTKKLNNDLLKSLKESEE